MSASSAKKQAQGLTGAWRTRTVNQTDVRCNIANCYYSTKLTKTVENQRWKAHGVAANKSVMDQSVSAFILTDSGALSDGSLETKTSTEIYNDTTNVKQSTQLVEPDDSDWKRGRSKEEDDEDADKKLKLGAQSQASLERQVIVKEALASTRKRSDSLSVSESLIYYFHVEVEKKKKEREEKDEEAAKKAEEEKKVKEKEDKNEEEKKEKRDKAKQTRKRKREQRKARTNENSSSMDIDDDLTPDSSNSKHEQAAKQTKKARSSKSEATTGVQTNRAAPASSEGRTCGLTHSNSQIPHPNSATFTQPQPPRHSHLNIPPPIPNFQHSIPNSFHFAPIPNPKSSVIPYLLPLGGQAQGPGTLGGENPWPVSNQTQLGIKLLRRQEVILMAAEQNLKLTEEEEEEEEEDDRSEGNDMI